MNLARLAVLSMLLLPLCSPAQTPKQKASMRNTIARVLKNNMNDPSSYRPGETQFIAMMKWQTVSDETKQLNDDFNAYQGTIERLSYRDSLDEDDAALLRIARKEKPRALEALKRQLRIIDSLQKMEKRGDPRAVDYFVAAHYYREKNQYGAFIRRGAEFWFDSECKLIRWE